MKALLCVLAVTALVVVAYAGEVATWWDLDDARVASKIELKMGKCGEIVDCEYHVTPDMVPPAVTAAMNALYPGLPPIAAEKELEGGQRFYELSVTWHGKTVEAMFTPAGEIHSQEIATAIGDPDFPVPAAVAATIAAKYPAGQGVEYEVILDEDGAVVEYHVKLTEGVAPNEKRYKLILTPGGYLADAYLEVVAELEVPIPPR